MGQVDEFHIVLKQGTHGNAEHFSSDVYARAQWINGKHLKFSGKSRQQKCE